MTDSGPDSAFLDAVQRRVIRISHALSAHAGGLELVRVSEGGEVDVRFTGMCTGCPLKPITMAGLIRPVLGDIEGVTAVTAPGGEISSEAQATLGSLIATHGSKLLVDRLKS